MKTFNNLDFRTHDAANTMAGTMFGGFDQRATMYFDNGYGVSVIIGDGAYTDEDHPFEVAVMLKDGGLTYDTHITDDVVSYCDKDKVTDIMRQVQELPKK